MDGGAFHIYLLLGFPLLGFLISGILGKKIPGAGAGILSSLMVFGSFCVSLVFFIHGYHHESVKINLGHWFHVAEMNVNFSFTIDHLSNIMLLIITGVGLLIHLYSIGYMKGDEAFHRFFAYLNLFVFFMIILVTGSNFILMFIGWEGVGLCSYLLIGFWHQNTAYNKAAKKAFVMNRIGDVGLVLAIFYILRLFNTIEFDAVNVMALSGAVGVREITIITLLLFLAATGKSAQVPLLTWLPDAMAGPTPVSALIHAATMVTAGIYMVIRNFAMFTMAPITMDTILWIGVATCLIGAIIGVKQNDIKKVLAYSTVSQLGLLFVALGAHAPVSSFFHLTTHAFFKALLFLGAGSVIHAMSGEQDIRKMGGLKKYIPVTYIVFLIGTLAISGIPPFAGFFSKDEILEHVFAHSPLAYGLVQFASLLTVFYMFRLFYLVFHTKYRGTEEAKHHLHESPKIITIPLIILAICSTFAGAIGLPHYLGAHHWLNHYLGNSIFTPMADVYLNGQAAIIPQAEHLNEPPIVLLLSIAVGGALLVWLLAWWMYTRKNTLPEASENEMNFFTKMVYKKFYLDEIYDFVFKAPVNFLSKAFYFIDSKIIDKIVNLTGITALSSGDALRKIQSGNIGLYLFIMTISVIGLILLQFILK
jgi:NADH-quinone oxidoreductase subunit L